MTDARRALPHMLDQLGAMCEDSAGTPGQEQTAHVYA